MCATRACRQRGIPGAIGQAEALGWSAILRSCSAWDAYKSLFGAEVHPKLVAEFLVLSEDFPRFHPLLRHPAQPGIAQDFRGGGGPVCQRRGTPRRPTVAGVQFSTVEEIFERGLHGYLDDVQVKLNAIGDCLFDAYFFLSLASLGEADFVQQEEQQQQGPL